jgi:cytochrome c-type biogenesis protein CcmF
MLGTLYPLALDALGLGKISVGAPYFEAVFVPLMAPVVLLMGVGPLARWKADAGRPTWRAAALAALERVVRQRLAAVLAGRWSFGIGHLGLFLAAWVFASTRCCSRSDCAAVAASAAPARWRAASSAWCSRTWAWACSSSA